jgi:hypothetical protein
MFQLTATPTAHQYTEESGHCRARCGPPPRAAEQRLRHRASDPLGKSDFEVLVQVAFTGFETP